MTERALTPLRAETPRDFAQTQIDRWESFAQLLERTIDRSRAVQEKARKGECGDPSCGVQIDADTIEALVRARELCAMEAEHWRARARRGVR